MAFQRVRNNVKATQPKEKISSVGTPVLGFEIKIIDEKGMECPPTWLVK